jgi:hypothetical protein
VRGHRGGGKVTSSPCLSLSTRIQVPFASCVCDVTHQGLDMMVIPLDKTARPFADRTMRLLPDRPMRPFGHFCIPQNSSIKCFRVSSAWTAHGRLDRPIHGQVSTPGACPGQAFRPFCSSQVVVCAVLQLYPGIRIPETEASDLACSLQLLLIA